MEVLTLGHEHHPKLVRLRKPPLAPRIQPPLGLDVEKLADLVDPAILPQAQPVAVEGLPPGLVRFAPQVPGRRRRLCRELEAGQDGVAVPERPGPLEVVHGEDGAAPGRDGGPVPPARRRGVVGLLFPGQEQAGGGEAFLDVPELEDEAGLRPDGQLPAFGAAVEEDDEQDEDGLRGCEEVRLVVRLVLHMVPSDLFSVMDL